jgi:hypothetical protein
LLLLMLQMVRLGKLSLRLLVVERSGVGLFCCGAWMWDRMLLLWERLNVMVIRGACTWACLLRLSCAKRVEGWCGVEGRLSRSRCVCPVVDRST